MEDYKTVKDPVSQTGKSSVQIKYSYSFRCLGLDCMLTITCCDFLSYTNMHTWLPIFVKGGTGHPVDRYDLCKLSGVWTAC